MNQIIFLFTITFILKHTTLLKLIYHFNFLNLKDLKMREILLFVVFILIVVAIFYGIWKLAVMTATKQAKKANEQRLLKMYKQGSYNQRLIYSLIFGVLFSPVGGIYMYYMFKKQHAIFQNELENRNMEYEHLP